MDIRTEAAIAAFVPSLLWLVLVYSRDRYEKEPKWLVAKLYVMSVLAVALAFVLESLVGPRLTGPAGVVIGSALAIELVETFLRAKFSGLERHVHRLAKVRAIENEFSPQMNADKR